MKNDSLNIVHEWTDEKGRKFEETIRQEYTGNNCVFSGGFVENSDPAEDTCYLKWEKDGEEETMILLRPDEVAAVNWICSGLLWSEIMREKK